MQPASDAALLKIALQERGADNVTKLALLETLERTHGSREKLAEKQKARLSDPKATSAELYRWTDTLKQQFMKPGHANPTRMRVRHQQFRPGTEIKLCTSSEAETRGSAGEPLDQFSEALIHLAFRSLESRKTEDGAHQAK